MIDRKFIGQSFAPRNMDVDARQIAAFANVIGETDPVYTDKDAAHAAGYAGQPAPPTFLFCLEMETGLPLDVLELLDIDIARILHGEEVLTYHAPAVAGDRLTFNAKITDIYEKKGGALEFFVLASEVTRQDGTLLAEVGQTIAVRNPAGGARK